jgi:hypothetical protein
MAHPRPTRLDTICSVLIDLFFAALVAAILFAG